MVKLGAVLAIGLIVLSAVMLFLVKSGAIASSQEGFASSAGSGATGSISLGMSAGQTANIGTLAAANLSSDDPINRMYAQTGQEITLIEPDMFPSAAMQMPGPLPVSGSFASIRSEANIPAPIFYIRPDWKNPNEQLRQIPAPPSGNICPWYQSSIRPGPPRVNVFCS
jgi:hypothetical protein